MKAADIMTSPVATVTPETPIAEAIATMLDQRISGLPVLDADGNLAGIITEGDLLRRVELGTERQRPGWLEFLRGPGLAAGEFVRTHGRLVHDVMTREVVTTAPEATLEEVVGLMESMNVKRVPVVEGERMLGLVSRADLLRELARFLAADALEGVGITDEEIARRLHENLAGQGWSPHEGVRIGVADGVVTLEGVIYDQREREALSVAAREIPGVRGVTDTLVWVEPSTGVMVEGPPDDVPDAAGKK
jgi:CBS domain-containing protein